MSQPITTSQPIINHNHSETRMGSAFAARGVYEYRLSPAPADKYALEVGKHAFLPIYKTEPEEASKKYYQKANSAYMKAFVLSRLENNSEAAEKARDELSKFFMQAPTNKLATDIKKLIDRLPRQS